MANGLKVIKGEGVKPETPSHYDPWLDGNLRWAEDLTNEELGQQETADRFDVTGITENTGVTPADLKDGKVRFLLKAIAAHPDPVTATKKRNEKQTIQEPYEPSVTIVSKPVIPKKPHKEPIQVGKEKPPTRISTSDTDERIHVPGFKGNIAPRKGLLRRIGRTANEILSSPSGWPFGRLMVERAATRPPKGNGSTENILHTKRRTR